MKAVTTKYHGPTNTRGARISASDGDGNRVTVPYPYEKATGEDAHSDAVRALCTKMDWHGMLVCGSPDWRRGVLVWVWVEEDMVLRV